MRRVEFNVLGPVEVISESGPVELRGAKQRVVLAVLLANLGRWVSTDRLLDEVWGDDPPASAINTLQSYLSRLRRGLGPERLLSGAAGYRVMGNGAVFDVAEFQRLVEKSLGEQDPSARRALLTEALSLWRGEPYEDVDDTPAIVAERLRLDEQRLVAVERRISADLDLGEHQRLVSELERLVDKNPFREGLWGQLMLGFYRSGRQADALAAYRRLRNLLAQELGVEPGPEIQALEERIIVKDPTLAALVQASPKLGFGGLPLQATSFVGRAQELAEVEALLASYRLLTVTGVGGAGKTRLALEVAAGIDHRYQHGVHLADLASLTDPGLIEGVVADAVGLPTGPTGRVVGGMSGARTAIDIVDFLTEKQILLVLDNCEHLVSAVASLADAILRRCPRLSLLATSRISLGVSGEAIYQVPPLEMPQANQTWEELANTDAVRLFADRAAAVWPQFHLDQISTPVAAEICRKLDGLPLAIELAASRVRGIGLAMIAARLDDRFRVLGGGTRTALPRHQTLLAAVDWSYALLSPEEARLFERLSIFRGGFDLAAAEEVGSDPALEGPSVLGLLSSLVDQSMMVAEEGTAGGPRRYRLLETLRQFGAEKLEAGGMAKRLGKRHALHYLKLAERGADGLRGDQEKFWAVRLDEERDNLRAALEWLLRQNRHEEAARMAGALADYWLLRGLVAEGRDWLERVRASTKDLTPAVEAKLLIGASGLANLVGYHHEAEEWGQQALGIYRRLEASRGIADALFVLGSNSLQGMGDWEHAEKDFRECLTYYQEAADSWGVESTSLLLADIASWKGDYVAALSELAEAEAAMSVAVGNRRAKRSYLVDRGWVAYVSGELELARELNQNALALHQELGDSVGIAQSLFQLALTAHEQGDLVGADLYFGKALSSFEEIGYQSMVAAVLVGWGWNARRHGDYATAFERFRESLRIHLQLGLERWVVFLIESIAGLIGEAGDPRLEVRLMAAAARQRQALFFAMAPWDKPRYEADLAAARASLGEEAFQTEWAAGQTWTRERMVALAQG